MIHIKCGRGFARGTGEGDDEGKMGEMKDERKAS